MPPQDLPAYVQWVIDQKSELRETPSDVKKELQNQLEERLENLINMALLAHMPATDLPYFEQLLDTGTASQIQQFVEAKIPNSAEVIAKVLVDFREDYVGDGGE